MISNAQVDPTPAQYFEHARATNEAARLTLRLDTRDASALQAKISLGLSLQVAELAGKGMLRVLGMSADEIRKSHKGHNVFTLLQDVDFRVLTHQNKALRLYGDFIRWEPIIEGTEFGDTLGQYLEKHFSAGPTAFPRSYFYPDYERFVGPDPIQAVYIMVEHIIERGEALMRACGQGSI